MIKIITDSTADLTQEVCIDYGIETIPMYIHLNGKNFQDGKDISPDMIFESVEKTLEEHQPDVVLVMTGIWDLIDRKLPGWRDFLAIGDPRFDAHMLAEYQRVADVLRSRGAAVLWLTTPCIDPDLRSSLRFGPLGGTEALSAARVDALNRTLLPRLVASRSGAVRLVDVNAHSCPDGRFPPRRARSPLPPETRSAGQRSNPKASNSRSAFFAIASKRPWPSRSRASRFASETSPSIARR